MCDCITKVDELLAERNGRLYVTINLMNGKAYPKLGVEKKETRSRTKPPLMIPTYCPFCGQRYEEEAGVEEIPLDDAKAGG